jgi:hypothetical protein
MAETYMGEVRGGVVVFDPGTPALPEGARIRMMVVPKGENPQGRTLAERYASIIGIAEGLPTDRAEEHDRYLHGTPRRDKD